jgi:hypothetical protein
MINSVFDSKLIMFKNEATSEGDVVSTFTIIHEEPGMIQDFLDPLSSLYTNNISKCLDYPEWKNVNYNVDGVHLKLVFDAVEMPVELTNIKVHKKEKKDEVIFAYSLTFQKVLNASVDPIFATSYLKRKEENEDGKMVICTYDTELKKGNK